MHEAGIAASVLEIAETEARKLGARAIRVVKLRMGDFSGVVADALEFAFDALKAGTLAEQAKLEIERIPLTAWCSKCQAARQPQQELMLWCPTCNTPLEVMTGQELDVEYIEIDEPELGREPWSASA